MRYLCLLITSIFCIFDSIAYEASHRIANPIESVDLHFRALLKSNNESSFGIKWDIADSLNYQYATLSTLGAAIEDSFGDLLELKIGTVVDGNNKIIVYDTLSNNYDLHNTGVSIRFSVGNAGAIIEFGVKQIDYAHDITFDTSKENYINVWADNNVEILRDDFSSTVYNPAEYADFGSIDQLIEYIGKSSDPNEGFWAYFDRNTDPLLSKMGGNYNLATIKNDNGYDIIYISGATDKSTEWQPLRIKGRISHATFPGAFDLIWFDPYGKIINYETSATILGDMLELRFPHWKSIVRFRRIAIE